MALTPQQITEATNYWKKFRKLPIGNAEMIMHLATFADEMLANKNFVKPVVMRSVCDDWIHKERVKMNDDKYCPICGEMLQVN